MRLLLLSVFLLQASQQEDAFKQLNVLFSTPQEQPARPQRQEKEKVGELGPVPINSPRLYRIIEYLSSDKLEGRAPLSEGSKLAQDYITAQMKESGLEPGGENGGYLQSVKKNVWGNEIGKNIVGVLKGNKAPQECVYVEAHYDHWGKAEGKIQPGANDNASGVAIMLELARLLSSAKPDRTIVFLASDFEEGAAIPMMGGLKGAAYHVENPYCSKKQIKMALVMDMLGGRFIEGAPYTSYRLFLMGSESDAALHSLTQAAVKTPRGAASRVFGIYAIEPAGKRVARADYGPFRNADIPFVFATSGIPPEYHTPQDTISKIDFGFMMRAGMTLLNLVKSAASVQFSPAGHRAHINWEEETKSLAEMADQLTTLDLTEAQAPYAAGVLQLTSDLEKRLPNLSEKEKKAAVQESVQKAVMTIMEMNGSLRLWQHLIREH